MLTGLSIEEFSQDGCFTKDFPGTFRLRVENPQWIGGKATLTERVYVPFTFFLEETKIGIILLLFFNLLEIKFPKLPVDPVNITIFFTQFLFLELETSENSRRRR